jgi:hypothetical protein
MKNLRFSENRSVFAPGSKRVTLLLTIIGTVAGWSFCSLAQAQSYKAVWAQRTSDVGMYIGGNPINAVDRQGNFFACSPFTSATITIGNATLTNSDSSFIPHGYTPMDSFVVKYNSNGELLWVRQITGGSAVVGTCAADSEGNLFVAGDTASSHTLIGTNVLSTAGGPGDAFVVKYDPNGNVLWARQIGGNGNEIASHIAVDDDNNAVIAGRFSSTNLLIGTNSLTWSGADPNSNLDAFVAKFSGSGDPLWARQIKTSHSLTPRLGIDQQNNIYITDAFVGSADFGDFVLTNSGSPSITSSFLAKYDSTGKALWAQTAAEPMVNDMAVDSQGDSYLVGTYTSPTLLVGGITLTSQGGLFESWLAKFDNAGNLAWVSPIGSPGDDNVMNVALDKVGNCYVFGDSSSATINFGSFISITPDEAFPPFGGAFVAKYSRDGNVLWTRRLLSSSISTTGGGKVDSLGTLYVAGMFGGFTNVFQLDDVTLNLPGPGINQSNGGYFFAKLNGPMLSTTITNNQLTLSWPTNAVGLHLESATSLSLGDWSSSSITNPPSIVGDQNTVMVDSSIGSRFFRLNGP